MGRQCWQVLHVPIHPVLHSVRGFGMEQALKLWDTHMVHKATFRWRSCGTHTHTNTDSSRPANTTVLVHISTTRQVAQGQREHYQRSYVGKPGLHTAVQQGRLALALLEQP